ncbi:MAG: MFS transporter [Deltaproteobacteria bacterium]|nr:MFS transporter [Deltaproteobacteria bacterium]
MAELDSRIPESHYNWFIVGTLFTIWTIIFGIQYSFGIFFRSLQDALGCSRGMLSWAMTTHLLVFALTMVPAGWAIDRFNIRFVYSVSAFGFGLPLALCSQLSELWQLYVFYGLLGISAGVYGPSIFAILARWFTEKRGLAFGLASCGAGFGPLVVAPLTNALIASYGWRHTFVILGLASTVILFACAQYSKNPPEQSSDEIGSTADKYTDSDQARRPNPLPGMTLGQAIGTREIIFIIAASSTAQITSRVIVVHIAPHATDMGISPFVAAMALSMIGGSSILGRIVMGFVQDRIGAQRSMIICLITMGACLFALPFVTSNAAFFVFAILFGLAFGGDIPQVPALTVQCFGVASMSVIYALVAGVVNMVSSLGPLAAGYIFDVTQSYTLAFFGAGILLFLGVFSVSRIK